jgi:hypothetical protein
MSTRLILWDLDFTAKGYIWPAVRSDSRNGKIIRYAKTNIYNTANTKLVNILTTPDPINTDIDDEFEFNEEITEYYNHLSGAPININPLPGSGAYLYNVSEPVMLPVLGTPFTVNDNKNVSPSVLAPGLYRKKYLNYYEENQTWFDNKSYIDGRPDNILSFNYSTIDDNFSMLWTGYFKPPNTGNYNFWNVSDDSCYIWIGDNALSGYTSQNAFINNGNLHPNVWNNNLNSVYLTKDLYYPIRIHFGEAGSYETMQVFYALAGENGSRDFTSKLFYNTVTNGF